jgi:integrase
MQYLSAAPLIEMIKGPARKPYPLEWQEQARLFAELPAHLERMALFDVNTGLRASELCGLRWSWEIQVPELDTSVFMLPDEMTKNGEERIVVLNRIARSVIESERGKHREYVFTYNGERIARVNNHAWRKARERAGLPQVRVHDLRHTFGHRLRAAGVSFEDRQDLLGHRSGRITTHYSAPDLSRLLHAVDSICEQKRATVLRLAGGIRQKSGKSPAVSNAAKSSALVS